MSEQESMERPALEAAIEGNPEAAAEFVRRLDAVNEFLDVVALGESAMTDEMIVELADTGSTLAESADGLATDETVVLAHLSHPLRRRSASRWRHGRAPERGVKPRFRQ